LQPLCYVLHNKIYYRASGGLGAPKRRESRFVPIFFGDEVEETADETQQSDGDNWVYDMQGRCVATPEQLRDGSWRRQAAPGIYILSGSQGDKESGSQGDWKSRRKIVIK